MKLFRLAINAYKLRDTLNHPELFWMLICNDGAGLLALMKKSKKTVQEDGIRIGLWEEPQV